ncbi:fungal-specific transcription factor domain-containing protein [Aspergillus unguis]
MEATDAPAGVVSSTGAGAGDMAPRQKRTAGSTTNDRASKRRSNRACLSCRNRKVRCDVLLGGHPCTNCRLDEIECILKESNRGRKPASATVMQASEAPQPEFQPQTPPQAARPEDFLVGLSLEGQQQPIGTVTECAEDNSVHTSFAAIHGTSIASPDRRDEPSTRPVVDGCVRHQLPAYVRPLSSHLSHHDIDYLSTKDALTIPDDELRDELLRIYVNLVYPFMPAAELEDFLGPIMRNDGRDAVSLILFQAVMFASITFVDAKLLHRCGYETRKEARSVFFQRVRLLHGLDCEPDRLALIQAVLLMTYWHDCPDDDKDSWYWMGIALSLAQMVRLHRNPANLKLTPKQKRLRRRIWWSCVMRDRLLALALRRTARIRDEDFDVAALTLDDFDLEAPSQPLIHLLGASAFTEPDAEGRRVVAGMIIELSQLCLCIGHILHSQYTVLDTYEGPSEYILKAIVRPRKSETRIQDLAKCDEELSDWLRSQDMRSRYIPNEQTATATGAPDKASEIMRLHRALLHMIYLTALGALHRPQVFYSDADETGDPTSSAGVSKVSRERVTQAAIAMTKLACDLQSSNQLRFLSTSSVPAFLSATLIHLLDMRSADDEVRTISIGRFYQCVQALQELQDIYASADFAIQFLETVLKSTDINVPTLKFGVPQPSPSKNVPWQDPSSTARPTLQTSPSRLATAYPSPSSSTNNQLYLNGGGGMARNEEASFSMEMMPPAAYPFPNTFDMWSGDGRDSAMQQQPGDFFPASGCLSSWSDIDSLLPALINYDVDPSLLLDDASMPFP